MTLTPRETALIRIAVREERRAARNEYLRIVEAVKVAKVSRRTIYRWMDAGLLPFICTPGGGVRLIKADTLDEFLAGFEDRMPVEEKS